MAILMMLTVAYLRTRMAGRRRQVRVAAVIKALMETVVVIAWPWCCGR